MGGAGDAFRHGLFPMLDRLRTDFRLSIITMLGACAILGITPFAIFRFYSGDVVSGVVDLALLAGVVLTVAYAWFTGRTVRSGLCMALFSCSGATLAASMHPNVGIFWLFPTFVTSFFLTSPLVAVTINSIAILVLVVHNVAFLSIQQMWTFVTTSLVVSACAYIFALRNEAQRLQLEQLATFDPLTGVRNRRTMDEELQAAVTSAARTGVPYALIMLDLDHFKRVNDNHGHSIGDKVLVQVAQTLEQSIRKADHLFRFGGEEFVILLTGTREAGAKSVIRSLREKMALEIESPEGTVTASFGAALLRTGEDSESWLARADAALYRAKDAGRDCFILDGSDQTPLR